jgi:hypothetical protein
MVLKKPPKSKAHFSEDVHPDRLNDAEFLGLALFHLGVPSPSLRRQKTDTGGIAKQVDWFECQEDSQCFLSTRA